MSGVRIETRPGGEIPRGTAVVPKENKANGVWCGVAGLAGQGQPSRSDAELTSQSHPEARWVGKSGSRSGVCSGGRCPQLALQREAEAHN